MGKRKASSSIGNNAKTVKLSQVVPSSLPVQNSSNDKEIVYPASFNSTSELMKKVKVLFTSNRDECEKELSILKEIKGMLDNVKVSYFKNITKGHPMKLAEENLNSCIDKINQVIGVDVTFVGSSGLGKSSLINMIIGEPILPCGDDIGHITRSILELSYAKNYEVIVQYCNEEEFNKRRALAPKEFASITYEEKKDSHETVNSVGDIREFLDKQFREMKDLDLIKVDKILGKLPVQLLQDFNLTIRDTPGYKSGTFSRIYQHFIEKSITKTNMILFFSEGCRGDVSTSIFSDFINPILMKAHKNPPSVKMLIGGRNISDEKVMQFKKLKEKVSPNKIDFAKLLSMYTDMDLEDVIQKLEPFTVDLPVNAQLPTLPVGEEFNIKNLREVCISIINRFNTLIVPHLESNEFESQKQDFLENFMHGLVEEQGRILHSERKNIIEITCALVPLLMSICVNNFSEKQTQYYLRKIENDLCAYMYDITQKFSDIAIEEYNNDCAIESYDLYMDKLRKSISKRLKDTISFQGFKKIALNAISEVSENYPSITLSHNRKTLLLSNIEQVLTSCKRNITTVCKQLYENLTSNPIFRKEFQKNTHLKQHTNIKNEIKTNMIVLTNFFNSLFDKNNNAKVNLIVETKFKLTELFEHYKHESQDDEYIYSINSNLPIPSKESINHTFKLTLPTEPLKYWTNHDEKEPWNHLSNCLATNDSLLKEKILRNPSKMNRELIVDFNGTRIDFSNQNKIQLYNLPVIHNLSKFQTLFTGNDEFIAPIMIFAKDEIKQNLICNTLSKNINSDNFLVFIFCQESNWSSISKLVKDNSSCYVIKVKSKKFNKGIFETSALEISKHYNFPIYHTMTQYTGRVQEYVSDLKSFKTASFTFIRYLRFSQITMKKELLEIDVTNLKKNIGQFLARVRIFITKLTSNDYQCFFDDTFETSNLMNNNSDSESFMLKLRELDEATGTSFAEDFLKIRLATNKARLVLWNGSSNMVKEFKVFNVKKNNYFISYRHDLNSINTCYTPSMVNALDDQKLFDCACLEEYCEQSLKSGLLFSGAGQFICYGFKFEKFNDDDYESENE
ncbi:predicted protein [Naegleria gruberi]|uniref:Predicted protein n=1 Tax=Naegleria gruberi TaxID=5762 RepID=D2W1M4_NAEGR|nr:uncharacterized protein NAEGRDRAFT_75306 [Naegleria gruberi]EFC36943.1 predicted protein [Naegleria gruberi]|eukprot:XP_002669687.1 predicted protein [Naegleria gruberi strain NEG-M]